jgi:galacturonosyltransferase
MKKVLFFVNHDLVIYNFRKELVERLLNEGYIVYVSSPYGERIDDLIAMGCKYIKAEIDRHGTSVFKDLKLLLYYKNIIQEIKPDVVLSYTIKPNIYGGMACRILKASYIANITGLGTAVENYGYMQKLTVLLYKIAFKKISCVFFQNEENLQFFIENHIAIGKHHLIPGSGVNLEQFKVLDYPGESVIRFAFISRIMKEKGIDQFLEAAKYIKSKYPQSRFDVCGFCEEDYGTRLKLFEEKKIIKYHGMVRDVRTILEKVHCTVHPSYYPEGISNVLLESAACARPVITTKRSGCREVVEDGYSGYLVEQKNTKDLIEKMERFLKLSHEEKKKMGILGRKKVEKEFDRQIIVENYMKEINDIKRLDEI